MSPIYTYECDTCGNRFESIQGWTTVTLGCPTIVEGIEHCKGTAKRVPSLPAPAQFNCSMPTYQKPKS